MDTGPSSRIKGSPYPHQQVYKTLWEAGFANCQCKRSWWMQDPSIRINQILFSFSFIYTLENIDPELRGYSLAGISLLLPVKDRYMTHQRSEFASEASNLVVYRYRSFGGRENRSGSCQSIVLFVDWIGETLLRFCSTGSTRPLLHTLLLLL